MSWDWQGVEWIGTALRSLGQDIMALAALPGDTRARGLFCAS